MGFTVRKARNKVQNYLKLLFNNVGIIFHKCRLEELYWPQIYLN